MSVAAKVGHRGLRAVIAATAMVANVPLTIFVFECIALTVRDRDRPPAAQNLLFIVILFTIGPLFVAFSSTAVVFDRKRAGVIHLVATALSIALNFVTAGILALGGPQDLGWFLLAMLLLLVSLVATIVLLVRAPTKPA